MEAMKSAVQIGLGAAFVSAAVVEKEAQLGTLAVLRVRGVPLVRHLQCVLDPARRARRACACRCSRTAPRSARPLGPVRSSMHGQALSRPCAVPLT